MISFQRSCNESEPFSLKKWDTRGEGFSHLNQKALPTPCQRRAGETLKHFNITRFHHLVHLHHYAFIFALSIHSVLEAPIVKPQMTPVTEGRAPSKTSHNITGTSNFVFI